MSKGARMSSVALPDAAARPGWLARLTPGRAATWAACA